MEGDFLISKRENPGSAEGARFFTGCEESTDLRDDRWPPEGVPGFGEALGSKRGIGQGFRPRLLFIQ